MEGARILQFLEPINLGESPALRAAFLRASKRRYAYLCGSAMVSGHTGKIVYNCLALDDLYGMAKGRGIDPLRDELSRHFST
jgi:hypothetical protein